MTTYQYFCISSVDQSGSTISSTESSSFTNNGGSTFSFSGQELNEDNELVNTSTVSTASAGASDSFSSSFISSTVFTALVQTSTTYSYEQSYEVTSIVTADQPMDTVWTTVTFLYDETKTGTVFEPTAGTQTSSLGLAQSETTVTEDDVTLLEQTITLSGLPDTVLQAQTRYAQGAEIIYAITENISNVSAFSAATDLAISGTQLTLSPRLQTAQKEQVNATRPTSSFPSAEKTSNFSITSVSAVPATQTTARYDSFPPVTGTQGTNSLITTQILVGINTLEYQIDETFGESTGTVTAREFSPYSTRLSRQIGSLTFEQIAQSVSSYTVTQTIEAAGSSSFSSSNQGTYVAFVIDLALGAGESSSATARSSSISANTVLPTARVATGRGGEPAQIKYGTIGAAIDGNVGGWLTANASSVGFVAFSNIYARDGAHRSATTMFPATNESRTIEGDSITWTTSTVGILSVDGATSKKTTTSAEIGVAGLARSVTFSRPISNFGGSAGEGETFVQTAQPGLYKNRINGSTAIFDGSASVIANGQSQSLAMWQAIADVRGMVSSTNANPVTWVEARNTNQLPPNTPFPEF
jgi:hypothetical protein